MFDNLQGGVKLKQQFMCIVKQRIWRSYKYEIWCSDSQVNNEFGR